MRNKVRAHRNGGTKSPSLQTKTIRGAGQKTGLEKNSVAVVLVDNHTEENISPVIDLTAAEFAAIQKDAAMRGETLDAWLCRTFETTSALRNLKIESLGPLATALAKNQPPAQPSEDKVWLTIVSKKDEFPSVQVELKPEQLALIQQQAGKKGLSLEALLTRLFLRMINNLDYSAQELKSACYQSNALVDLFSIAMTAESHPDWNGPAGAGLVELAHNTQSRLAAAFAKTDAAWSHSAIIPGGAK